ncbi:MBL fold metallo-hydrolase [Konateibacter massiliensis]|uniref:MBL fold metallo-hydrolase n=1 Tax=Konateibacter massiliensis TaxID=2002841 RepID=UPI000C14860F|nr:MBL fold metallo-hydrolase [Konateibacter massiliensis]
MKLCSITSGSSGNCIYIGSDNTHLMIDAGISGKRIENGLNQIGLKTSDMNGILITHEHSDHISGLGVVARKYGIPIYATQGTIGEIRRSRSLGAIPEELFQIIREDEEFCINDLTVHPFSVSHDAAQPVAYRICKEEKSIAVATDLGKYDDYTIENLKDLDVLLLEANHDINMLQVGSYPYYLKQRILGDKGHLSNELSGRLLGRLMSDKLKAVVLGHLSRENNYEELAYETVRLEISMSETAYKPEDFYITVAKRDAVSELITV